MYSFFITIKHSLRLFVAVALLSPVIQLPAHTQNFLPDAPVINFKLPMFNEQGFRYWEMHGQKGTYLNDEEIEIEGMTLRLFSGNADQALESTIESAQSTLLIKEDCAYGNDSIHVQGQQYFLSGKNWYWIGKEKKMIINQDVKVLFDQSLSNILIYENE